ncbi:hypothetical protein JTB14_027268 [Gonioctena quinquepunctata]|nr:hypothetical protein JTB14_027268 [Gonioctena quinquepunctata]
MKRKREPAVKPEGPRGRGRAPRNANSYFETKETSPSPGLSGRTPSNKEQLFVKSNVPKNTQRKSENVYKFISTSSGNIPKLNIEKYGVE